MISKLGWYAVQGQMFGSQYRGAPVEKVTLTACHFLEILVLYQTEVSVGALEAVERDCCEDRVENSGHKEASWKDGAIRVSLEELLEK